MTESDEGTVDIMVPRNRSVLTLNEKHNGITYNFLNVKSVPFKTIGIDF